MVIVSLIFNCMNMHDGKFVHAKFVLLTRLFLRLQQFNVTGETYLRGSESCPSLGLLLGLLARGQPDKLRWEE